MSILLIHPPVVKPCEPPPGIAMLAGSLRTHAVPFAVLDANIEGLLFLANQEPAMSDTWTRRAFRNRYRNLEAISHSAVYRNFDRYKRALSDINRLIHVKGRELNIHVSLSDYRDSHLSPLRSGDCIKTFEYPEMNLFYPYFAKRITELLEDIHPDWIGFSLNFLSQALTTFAMIGFIKKVDPTAKIVLGGGLATSWVRNPSWRNPFKGIADEIIDGPGENRLLSLLGKDPSAHHITPCYDDFALPSYFSPGFILPYSASRGCYWRQCSFCPERAEGNAYIPLHPCQVTKDLQYLGHNTAPILIHMLDNAISPRLLKKLAQNSPGVPWYGFARVSELLTDLDFCISLKRAGCRMLKLGIESGSQRVLDEMGKGINLEAASKVLYNLHKVGIGAYVYLLFGTPFERSEDARKTLDFAVKHSGQIDYLNLAVFNLPAYGPDAERYDVENFYEGDLTLYYRFRHPHGWHRHHVRKFLEKEFKRHPAIAHIIRRDPPFFSSNHAPLFTHR